MISNFPDIFRQNIFNSVSESTGDFLAKSALDYNMALNPDSPTRKFFNKNNILDLIRRKKYDRAIKLIKANKINAFSLFDGVSAFGNTYDKIPFVAAALAMAIDSTKKPELMHEKFNRVFSEVFVPSGINASNMFDAKFSSKNGCDDVLSFVLTRDGTLKASDYSEENDLDMLVLINYLLSNGYSITNSGGMLRYVMDNDLISSLKRLVESGTYSLDINDIKKYSLSPVSNIGRYISLSAPHPFRLHSPEIEFDDKGKFSGGSMFSPLKSVGYDISKPDKEFKVHISIPFMIRDFINDSKRRYSDGGENFTNDGETNLGDGSEFMTAVNSLRYLSSEYGKYMKSKDISKIGEDDRKRYMSEMVRNANANILSLQNGLNSVLHAIGLPSVVVEMKNKLDENDGKILYKTAPFMREIWNSIKLCK